MNAEGYEDLGSDLGREGYRLIESGITALWDGMQWAYEQQLLPLYEQHVRRNEYRAMTLDNDIMQCVAELRSVKAVVQQRIDDLREQSQDRGAAALRCVSAASMTDARDHFRLKMLYDAQYDKAQRTLMAIEAHIVSMEASLVNRRVMRALRTAASSSRAHGGDDDEEFEDAMDDLAEQNRTSQLVRESVEGAAELLADNTEVEEHMQQWLAAHQTCAATPPPPKMPPPPSSSPLSEVVAAEEEEVEGAPPVVAMAAAAAAAATAAAANQEGGESASLWAVAA